ncbi:hypothetical protein SAMN05421874_12412 [Nonomuraea maritima]|uniref:Uncharacterized protein n=1 Tax=Nonomuraea maritima TaxID=683260 RepID=A0A1G9L4C6_9ACTN|nr:hypothetical protein [Nonomuraea maritima]SDL56839.1 hypothetical protein SAMN05421874_12412 [Nonomuraea maritima]
MAFSQDKGRHRRGRWWRRGSYLFSRRTEAPDTERSFWSSVRQRRQEARETGRGHDGPEQRRRPGESELRGVRTYPGQAGNKPPGQGLFGQRRESSSGQGPESPWQGPESPWQGPESSWQGPERRRASWDGPRERHERLPAAVAERPRHTWYDFELDDGPAEARPHRPDAPSLGDGLLHCGRLEEILHRQWDAQQGPPPPESVRAVESLARLPDRLKDKLADGLEGIYVGAGGVPDLDDMGYLRGAPLPSGRATWDICAGAYGDRKIVVGDRPSPTPDVMMHEVGHAIDDIDAAYGTWVSDSPEFVRLYEAAQPLLASMFHRQGGGLGRKEFFADAFAAIAARQRPALVDMLGGDTRMALDIMLFFNRRYGI